ncbi:hypothetical protein SJA_C1-21590 [Sphingobium indicum UT26S]|uniref:Uncharacterized protein n=1 Tax=Sphingobium indicum (strain DSM 16413 / CCM 7287 / MTCC 6362 / UT26 / NBRC 101211 / UT26S) TaxID=452662 RepID=D4Z311_SPHIU|nr:hypothetical protein SJA_C1-21590 [Sphingobium indicum UT26S]
MGSAPTHKRGFSSFMGISVDGVAERDGWGDNGLMLRISPPPLASRAVPLPILRWGGCF